MADPRLEDHVVGLELQLVELVERRERALVQGQADEAEALSGEIDEIQTELIVAAEALAADKPVPHADVLAESAEDATFTMTDAGMHRGPESDTGSDHASGPGRDLPGDADPSPASHLGV